MGSQGTKMWHFDPTLPKGKRKTQCGRQKESGGGLLCKARSSSLPGTYRIKSLKAKTFAKKATHY